MKILISILSLVVGCQTLANTISEDFYCGTRKRTIRIAESNMSISDIEVYGSAVTIRSKNKAQEDLKIQCSSDLSKLPEAQTMMSNEVIKRKMTKVQKSGWLLVQKTGRSSTADKWYHGFSIVGSLWARISGTPEVSEKEPILITNSEENPIRTQIEINPQNTGIYIRDPLKPNQILSITCNPKGQLSITGYKERETKSLIIQSSAPPEITPNSRPSFRETVKCATDFVYNFETNDIVAESSVQPKYNLDGGPHAEGAQ